MSNITKEQIIRLEKVGLAMADSISDEYSALEKSYTGNKEIISRMYNDFGKIVGDMNKEGINNAE